MDEVTTTELADQPAEQAPAELTLEQEDAQRQAETDRKEQEETEKKPWFKKRFDEMTRKRYEEARRADEERERRIKLEEEVERLKTGKKEPVKPPQSTGRPTREQHDFDEERYIEAVADWKFAQREAQKQAEKETAQANEQRQRQQQTHLQKQAAVAKAGMEKHNDWLDTVNSVPMPSVIRDITLEMTQGADVAYFLAKNPSEIERIGNMLPYAMAAELGKIEVKIANPTKKSTNAPPPINPVGGAGLTSNLPDPDKDPQAWIAARNRGEI